MKFNNETRAFGSIRKTRRWGTCGVILGLATLGLMTSPVRADERVNPNPATNAKSLQDSPTVDSTKDQGSAEKSTGSVEVTVNREKVESAVSAAKKAGLIVKETEVDGGLVTNSDELAKKTAEIESSYDKQATTIVDESEKVETRKKEKQDSYDKAKDQYDKDLAEYNRKLAELRGKRVQGGANGVTIYGEFDESKRGSLDYYSKLTAVFDDNPELEVVDGALGANANTTMSLDKDLQHDRLENKDFYGHSDSKGTYGGSVITGIKQGSIFTLHNVGKTKTGKTISARFVTRNNPIPAHKIVGNPSTYTRLNVWWNKAKTDTDISSVNFNPYNYTNVEWDIHYFDEKSGKAIDLGYINIYSDLDYAQAVRHTYGDNGVGVVINPTDSLVKETTVNGQTHWMGVKTDGVYKHNDPTGLERYKIGDPDYIDVDDYRATPEGTIISAGHGSIQHLTYLLRGDKPLHTYTESQSASYRKYWNDERRANGQQDDNDDEIFAAGYTFQLWGGRSIINQLEEPKPPLKPSESTTPRVVEVTYTRLRTTPTVEKLVKNSAGTNVNNSSVPKLSEVVWELETKPLAANRKETTIYELTDNLPQGYLLDLAKTVAQNQDFTVTYDKDKHQLKGSLKAEGLVKVNTDLSKAYKTPVLKVYGTVTNDGATYKNNFRLNLNNEFESYSNIAKVTTPGKPNDPDNPNNNLIKPLKHNHNKDGVIIDGKTVLAGSTNYYHITLDYDQYKGIKADPSAILKGFGAIDDYPEEAVTINKSDIRYIDSEGKEVSGISVYQYDSIEAVDNDKVKAFLDSSEIKPKGAFQVFLVDDPEAYFKQYIKAGKSVTIIDPMVTKEELRNSGKSFENTAYQVDFGNGYQTDTVVNNVPTVKPTKKNLNKAGVNIDGKQVLAGSVNYYKVTADYSQYKGIEADKDRIGKGFYIVDDYPEEAVTINQDGVQVTDSKGQVVKGLKMALYESLEKAPSGIQEALKSSHFTPKGAIQVFEAENPEEFYKTYVQAGEVLTITNPMTVKKELGQTGGKYENTAYQLDFGSGYQTDKVENNVPTAKPGKKNLNKAGVNIGGKQVLAGSVNYYKVTADYSQYKGIEADKDRIAKGFYIVDDYPEEAVTINQDGVQVTDSKGQVVKGLKMALYESLEKSPSGVQEALKSSHFTPKGAIQVFEAENPEEFYKTYVQAGEVLTITNPMTVKKELGQTGGKYENTAYQLDFGSGYQTDKVENNVPTAKPTKKNLNKAGVNIDGKQVLAGSVNYYKVTADYSQYKGIEADKDRIGKGFYIVDDYPEEAVTINQDGVQVTDSKGQVVKGLKMALYESLDKAPTGVQEALKSSNFTPKGAIQVFEAENPEEFYKTYVQAGEVLTITNPMTVKKELGQTGGKYENIAYQLDFGSGYQTDKVENNVPTAKPGKKNLNKAGVNIGGKQVLADSVNYYKVTADYSQYKGIEADKDRIAKGFYIVDDYPEEAVTINQDGVQVTDSKGQVVKGLKMALYESLDKAPSDVQEALKSSHFTPKGAIQVFEAENPEEFYKTYVQAGEVLTITNPMTVKKELGQTGGKYENTAYQLDFGSGYQTDKVENNVPTAKPGKKNLNKAGVNIGGKQVLAGSVNYYKVTADYSQYKGIEADKDRIAKGFYIVDDYPEEAVTINQDGVQVTDSKGQVVKGLKMALYESLAKAPSGVQEALKSSHFTPKGAIQVFEAENPEEFYKTYVQTGEVLTITNPMTVKKELGQTGGKYENTAYQLDFGSGYQTDKVENNVPTAKPTKKNLNKAGVNIDGKQVLAGSVNYYKVTADYSQYKGIEADKDRIAKGFYIVDDYPEEAVTINQDGVQVTDSKGQVVKGLKMALYESLEKAPSGVQEALKSSHFTPKGAIQVFEAENPEEFYKTYVQTGEVLTITNPMTVKKELGQTGGKYENTAYQVDFGNGYQTDTVVNNVPTAKPGKKNLNKAGVNIGGKQVLAGSVNYYKVTADYSQYKGIEADKDRIAKGFYIVDDYPEEAVTINQDGVQVTDSKGQVVKGLKMALYESLEKAPSGVQEALKSSHFTPKGAIQVFEAENPEEFYKTYVQAGEVLTITNPMTVKKELGQTGGKYENTAYQLDFGSGYQTDKVENNVPTAKPTKKNLNKAGVNIGGKQVLAGSVNYYKVTADYSQYKGIEADKDRIAKGFYIVDDYPEEAVTINQDGVQVTDSKGQVVKGLKMALYESLDKAPSGVQEALKSSHFTPKGAIQVFEAENPEEFYKTYVQAGEILTITNPMTVKKELGQTGGKYENTAYQLDFGSGYQTDKVENNVPTAKPGKKNLNKEGVDIDGKQVLPGSVNYYKVTADYSQYKGIEADKDRIAKGFYIVDDYPEEAVTINQDGVQVTDSKGQVVKGLKMALYESLAKAPSGVQEALKSSHFTPKGAIQVFEAENPEEFYKTYVQAGEVLTITNPMTVKKELGQTGGKYENTAYQVDFGMAYVTETVVNNVPKIEPKKDVVIDHLSKESLDGKEVKLNQTFNYKLVGSLVPKDRSEELFEYKFSDDYDETHDDYQSVYQVFAAVDFETSDGQKFKAGDELTKFTSQVVDKAKGKVDIGFDDAFLKSILDTSEFQAEVYLQMTRIQAGAVENTNYHTVNGVEVVSNTVVTHTLEEPKTPEEHPQQPERSLPSTGEQASAEFLLAGLVMGGAAAGLLYSKRKKKEA